MEPISTQTKYSSSHCENAPSRVHQMGFKSYLDHTDRITLVFNPFLVIVNACKYTICKYLELTSKSTFDAAQLKC